MTFINRIKDWFKTPFDHPEAMALYRATVNQSRLPVFYQHFGVADTPDGRFDMIALHAFLVMRRLKSAGTDAHRLSQSLHDLMFADMDQNMRELGVGDHGMPRRMKKLAEGFRGRIVAYDSGLKAAAEGNPDMFASALQRNLYRKMFPSDRTVAAMVAYIIDQDRHLTDEPVDRLLRGRVTFLPPGPGGSARK